MEAIPHHVHENLGKLSNIAAAIAENLRAMNDSMEGCVALLISPSTC